MAKQTIIKLLDDLSGGNADETVHFAYDGVEYTIDLNAKNATKLRTALEPFAAKGVKVTPAKPHPNRVEAYEHTPAGRAMMRAWAKKHMSDQFPHLGQRGRIPTEVIAAYRAAGKPRSI